MSPRQVIREMVELRPNAENVFFGALLWDQEVNTLVMIHSDGTIITLGAPPRGNAYGPTAMVILEDFLEAPDEEDNEAYGAWSLFNGPELAGMTLALQEIGAIATVLEPTNNTGGLSHSVVELTADLGAGARPHELLENLATTLSPAINMAIVDELITVASLIDSLADPEELSNITNLILFRARAHQRAAALALSTISTERIAL